MFEAHTLSAADTELTVTPDQSWQRTYNRLHQKSLRPLKIWFAPGKRKDAEQQLQQQWFVYIEYRDDEDNNRFHCFEQLQQGSTVKQLLELAVWKELPGLK